MTEQNANPFPTDTRLRPLPELMTRLIRPIPARFITQKPDRSKAEYVNVTTLKDFLDWACGFGRWRAEVARVDTPGSHLGMIVRLTILYAGPDGREREMWQDGTGEEVTNDAKIYGDPWTNAYAQALRRAAESFGMGRELWRRDRKTGAAQTTRAQDAAATALQEAARHADELPKAADEDAETPAASDAASRQQPPAQRAEPDAPAATGDAGEVGHLAPKAKDKATRARVAKYAKLQAEGKKLATQANLEVLLGLAEEIPWDVTAFIKKFLNVPSVGKLKDDVVVAMIDDINAADKTKAGKK